MNITQSERPPQRLGWFEVSVDMVRDQWPQLMEVMKHFVVVQSDQRFDTRTIRYLAYSPLFTICPPEIHAPWYHITIHREEQLDGTTKYTTTAELINGLTEVEKDAVPPLDRRRLRIIER